MLHPLNPPGSIQRRFGYFFVHLKIYVQSLAYFIWALELETETLFMDNRWRDFRRRLGEFLPKLLTRLNFLIVGGYHATWLRYWAKDCERHQLKTLRRIIRQNQDTVYGKELDFTAIESYQDYVTRVPLNTYNELAPYIDRQTKGEKNVIVANDPILFATTSGTTGRPKYIPITKEAQKKSHADVQKTLMYMLARRNIGFLNENILVISGRAIEGYTASGIPFGATSGHIRKSLPAIMNKIFAVPNEVFEIDDYESRYLIMAFFCLQTQISNISTANPSTLVILFEKMHFYAEQLITAIETGILPNGIQTPNGFLPIIDDNIQKALMNRLSANPERAAELRRIIDLCGYLDLTYVWPRLASVCSWKGGNAHIFLSKLRKYIGDTVPIFDLGYLSSEFRATVPIERLHHGGLPIINRNFFEFIATQDWEKGNRVPLMLHQLALGERYYVIVTTDCGLYRYHINDIVKVVGYYGNTPEIIFEQKGEGVTNLTGEKVYEQQVQIAFTKGAETAGFPLVFYLAVLNHEQSRYEFLVETTIAEPTHDSLQALLTAIDWELGQLSIEYQAKRQSLRLKSPLLHLLSVNAYSEYRRRKIAEGMRDAQFKMVHLSGNSKLIEEFIIKESVSSSKI